MMCGELHAQGSHSTFAGGRDTRRVNVKLYSEAEPVADVKHFTVLLFEQLRAFLIL